MPWKSIDGRQDAGIRVSLKNDKYEEFLHASKIKYSAQVWQSEYLSDKTERHLEVGYWDTDGHWRAQASFPPGSYVYVRVIPK